MFGSKYLDRKSFVVLAAANKPLYSLGGVPYS